jgi:hypothetical protein
MSVTGWYMMALKSGEMAGLTVPPAAFDNLTKFLDSVSVEGGSRYGYRLDSPLKPPTGVTPAVSAEGLLARQFLGWGRDDRRVAAGLEVLFGERFLDFENDKDVYAWYYITQVAHNVGGTAWARWNGRMREVLPAEQSTKGTEAGSWDPALDKWGHIGGRLFTTCFCTWMLEVYYRHLPLYEAVALGQRRRAGSPVRTVAAGILPVRRRADPAGRMPAATWGILPAATPTTAAALRRPPRRRSWRDSSSAPAAARGSSRAGRDARP